MGTNYYAAERECPHPCSHCEQQEWHICKSMTSFQGHKVSPWGRIESWTDWKRILGFSGIRIRDEYGHFHEREDFIERVEATEPEDRRRQYEWMRDHGYPTGPGHEWLDADQFSFTFNEFS